MRRPLVPVVVQRVVGGDFDFIGVNRRDSSGEVLHFADEVALDGQAVCAVGSYELAGALDAAGGLEGLQRVAQGVAANGENVAQHLLDLGFGREAQGWRQLQLVGHQLVDGAVVDMLGLGDVGDGEVGAAQDEPGAELIVQLGRGDEMLEGGLIGLDASALLAQATLQFAVPREDVRGLVD